MSVTHSFHSAAFELRRISWTQLAGYAYLGFFILLLVRLAAPEAIGAALRKLAFALPLVLLAAKDLPRYPASRRPRQRRPRPRHRTRCPCHPFPSRRSPARSRP